MADRHCPRCDEKLPPPPVPPRAGRPPMWCSQRCRRAAYEERRAAANGAIAVRVEVIEKPVERIIERVRVERHVDVRTKQLSPAEAAQVVLGSPRACATVLEALAAGNLQGPNQYFWEYGYARRAAASFAAATRRANITY